MGLLAQVEWFPKPALPLAFRSPNGATGKYAGATRFAAGCAICLANSPRPEDSGRRD